MPCGACTGLEPTPDALPDHACLRAPTDRNRWRVGLQPMPKAVPPPPPVTEERRAEIVAQARPWPHAHATTASCQSHARPACLPYTRGRNRTPRPRAPRARPRLRSLTAQPSHTHPHPALLRQVAVIRGQAPAATPAPGDGANGSAALASSPPIGRDEPAAEAEVAEEKETAKVAA